MDQETTSLLLGETKMTCGLRPVRRHLHSSFGLLDAPDATGTDLPGRNNLSLGQSSITSLHMDILAHAHAPAHARVRGMSPCA